MFSKFVFIFGAGLLSGFGVSGVLSLIGYACMNIKKIIDKA